MRKRFTATIKTPGKKLVSFVTYAFLVLALGTTSVFADDGSKKDIVENGSIAISNISLTQVYPNPYKVFVNGKEVAVEGYNINGNSYFNLQDIHAVTDFNVEFEKEKMVVVTSAIKSDEDAPQTAIKKGMYYSSYDNKSWDEETSEDFISSTVMVKTENDIYYYSTDGGITWNEFVPEELNSVNSDYEIVVENMRIYPDTCNAFVNGDEAVFEGYTINGNSIFKLRDIGEAANFNVDFENDTIFITTATKDSEYVLQDAVKNGAYYYSIDDDKTWDEATSEDFVTTTVMVKNENDIYYYSTDGGITWNEFALEDFSANNGLIIQR